MCARYVTFNAKSDDCVFDIAAYMRVKEPGREICPTDTAPVFISRDDLICMRQMRWGLPMQRSGVIFNARTETIDEKKLFRQAYLMRRCVIPAFGFYEWDGQSGRKYMLRSERSDILYMAGLYQQTGEDARFVVITTQASGAAAEIHSRMPLIFNPGQAVAWLESLEKAQNLRYINSSGMLAQPILA